MPYAGHARGVWVGAATRAASACRTDRSRVVVRRLASQSGERGCGRAAAVAEPTDRQLRVVAMRAAIPMIGFGFMDNLVMIQAGEAIDMTLGVAFGLSTLTAAGFGQCFSDVAGITCGGIVDATVAKMGLPHHGLSQAQLALRRSRIWTSTGGCVGVVCGCLLGMSCLLFMDTERTDRLKKARELTTIFTSLMDDGHRLVSAERCALWMLDDDRGELWTHVATGLQREIRIAATTGVVGACVASGAIVTIHDAYQDPRFHAAVDEGTGFRTRSIMCVPVRNRHGKVIGAVQMINKKKEDGSDGTFDATDAKIVTMLSLHVNAFTAVVNGSS